MLYYAHWTLFNLKITNSIDDTFVSKHLMKEKIIILIMQQNTRVYLTRKISFKINILKSIFQAYQEVRKYFCHLNETLSLLP